MDDLDIDEMKDVYGDLNDFDQRLKVTKQSDPYARDDNSNSSDDEPSDTLANVKRRNDPMF